MAFQTDAQLQAELDTNERGIRLTRRIRTGATAESIYCIPGLNYPGQAKWVDVDPTDTAVNQGVLIKAALRV